jgi:hypothetical protein
MCTLGGEEKEKLAGGNGGGWSGVGKEFELPTQPFHRSWLTDTWDHVACLMLGPIVGHEVA